MRRALAAAAAALLVLGAGAPAARADGDPASDVLAMQDAYYPYAPPTRRDLRRALDGVLRRARAAGYPIKVAMILTARDLGAYPSLFNRPNDYAELLARELPSNRHGPKLTGQHILVVMPGGFGGVNLGARVDAALSPVPIRAEAQSDGLAVAAIGAVARLATVNGHRVATPPEASLRPPASHKPTTPGGPPAIVFLAPAVLVFAGALIAGRRMRG